MDEYFRKSWRRGASQEGGSGRSGVGAMDRNDNRGQIGWDKGKGAMGH